MRFQSHKSNNRTTFNVFTYFYKVTNIIILHLLLLLMASDVNSASVEYSGNYKILTHT